MIASKDLRDKAAEEFRLSRKPRADRRTNKKRAAAYKALAHAEEWLAGEREKSKPKPKLKG